MRLRSALPKPTKEVYTIAPIALDSGKIFTKWEKGDRLGFISDQGLFETSGRQFHVPFPHGSVVGGAPFRMGTLEESAGFGRQFDLLFSGRDIENA